MFRNDGPLASCCSGADRHVAVEQRLKAQLDNAGLSYTQAGAEEKTAARIAYLAALKRFTDFVSRGMVPSEWMD